MTALLCIDTETRKVRRYIPQVLAGIRRAKVTHECEISPPQEATLPVALQQFLVAPSGGFA